MKTNVAKEVFEALATTIPRGHPLYPLLNRHTVKVSYSTMPNLQKKVNNHNKKILEEEYNKEGNNNSNSNKVVPKTALWEGLSEINAVYVGSVTRLDNFDQKRYTVHRGT